MATAYAQYSRQVQFLDRNRTPGVTYAYYIIAVDASGNTSAANVITVTQACPKK